MFNLNEKYFSIGERCGRNHQNKFCLRPLKGRFYPWELRSVVTVGDPNQLFQITWSRYILKGPNNLGIAKKFSIF